ncbi:MAG TPA: hypothetical protein VMG59_06415 [Phycisphaerae bacterium]|nr:hypothetical protein [Phycisphaerae bacterium]
MKSLPIDKYEQIEAMLAGRFFDVVQEHGQDPRKGDFRRFISVDRQQIIDYLRLHSGRAMEYFEKYSAVRGTHDVAVIFKDGAEYVVAWMDRGHPRDVRRFSDIAEADAEHMLINHGKY